MDLQTSRCGGGCTILRPMSSAQENDAQERESRLGTQIWKIWAHRKQRQVDSIIKQQGRTEMESMAIPTIKGQVGEEE